MADRAGQGTWELWDDAEGVIIGHGTEDQVKDQYMEVLEKGTVDEINLFIEAPDGSQYAWNRNANPPEWDEI